MVAEELQLARDEAEGRRMFTKEQRVNLLDNKERRVCCSQTCKEAVKGSGRRPIKNAVAEPELREVPAGQAAHCEQRLHATCFCVRGCRLNAQTARERLAVPRGRVVEPSFVSPLVGVECRHNNKVVFGEPRTFA